MDEILDVILITHNRLDQTIRCLDALYGYTHVPFKLTVIDDSTDLTEQWFNLFAIEKGNVNYIRPKETIKCAGHAINIGLRYTTSEIILFLTASTYVQLGYLVQALRVMEETPDAGAVGFKLLYPDGRIIEAGAMVNPATAERGNVGMHEAGYLFCHVREVDVIGFAVVLLRREALNFEEDFYIGFRGWEDVHNCLEMRERGWKIIYCGLGAAIHELSSSQGKIGADGQAECSENGRRFIERWAGNTKWTESLPLGERDRRGIK
ncbi:hypothetical protein ES703_09111 [subsurface metagenome]